MAHEESGKGRETIPGTQTLIEAEEFGDEVLQDATRGEGAFAGLAKSTEGAATGPPLRLRIVRSTNILGFEDTDREPGRLHRACRGEQLRQELVDEGHRLRPDAHEGVHEERVDTNRVLLARGRNLRDTLLPVPEVRTFATAGSAVKGTTG